MDYISVHFIARFQKWDQIVSNHVNSFDAVRAFHFKEIATYQDENSDVPQEYR